MHGDPVIETLLDLDGSILEQGGGYWIKIDAARIPGSPEVPHGIRYSLTLHEPYGRRILGYDNAHAVKPPKNSSTPGASWHSTISIGTSLTKGFLTNSKMRSICLKNSSETSTCYFRS